MNSNDKNTNSNNKLNDKETSFDISNILKKEFIILDKDSAESEYNKLRSEMLVFDSELSETIEKIDMYVRVSSRGICSDDVNCIRDIFNIYKCYSKKRIPPSIVLPEYRFTLAGFHLREMMVSKFGYCLPSLSWIEPLSNYLKGKRVLEIMAGNGILSYLLKERGVDSLPTDNFSWKNNLWEKNQWMEVENINCIDAINKYCDFDVILCSWPPMEDDFYNACKLAKEINPNVEIVYIGELEGGCTASDKFFEEFEDATLSEPLMLIANNKYSPYEGIHDSVFLYK